MLRMSDAITDMVAYTNLTDDITRQIMHSDDKDLQESKGILKRVHRRQLYKFIGQVQPKKKKEFRQDIKPKWIKEMVRLSPGTQLTKDQLVIDLVNFNYGKKRKNPMENVWFYSKKKPNLPFQLPKDEVSKMLPQCFAEQQIRIYCKSLNRKVVEEARKCIDKWCLKKGFVMMGNKPVEDNIYSPPVKKRRTEQST